MEKNGLFLNFLLNYMKIEIYNKFNSSLEKTWQNFEGTSKCTPFQSFDWLKHWHESVGDPLLKITPSIIVIEEDKKVVALLPLGIRRLLGIRVLEWLGGNNTDYMCPLISEDSDLFTKDFKNTWKKIIEKLKPLDLIFLSKQLDLKKGNPFVSILENKVLMNSYQCFLKGNWESFSKENLSKKVLADCRRQRKRLSKLGKISFTIVKETGDLKATTKIMIKQKSRRYIETGSWDMFSIKEYRDFYLNLKKKLGIVGETHVSYLSLDNEVIATHWGLVSSDTFYYLMPTYEGDGWERFSPGKLLLEFLLKWSLENNLKVFDLTVGDELYKKRWSNKTSPIYEHISPVSFYGKIYVFAKELKEYIKRIPVLGTSVKRIFNFFRN